MKGRIGMRLLWWLFLVLITSAAQWEEIDPFLKDVIAQ
jgi:hypothetical protein